MKISVSLVRLFTALVTVTLSVDLTGARAADHRDGPLFPSQLKGAVVQRDINDIFVFRSPANPANTVIAMTFQPFPGIFAPKTFLPATPYVFNFDLNGDFLADTSFKVTFSAVDRTGAQKLKLYHIANRRSAKIAEGLVGQPIQLPAGGQVMADEFDDPFFFDFLAFRNNFAFTDPGDDFFRGTNVLAIVLEVPTGFLLAGAPGSHADFWGAVLRGATQIDRMGRPSINAVLIPPVPSRTAGLTQKDFFNKSHPKDDVANFRADVIATMLAGPFNRSQPDAEAIANQRLPDILTYDCNIPGGFPNGRKLDDDVMDAELKFLLNDPGATDGVDGNAEGFRTVFPYLQVPNP